MLSRVAAQIFWMSRYVERAISISRVLDVILQLELDAGDEDLVDLWQLLLGAGGPLELETTRAWGPAAVRRYLAFEARNPNALLSCIHRARAAARGVRESISSEMFEQLNALYLSVSEPQLAQQAEDDPYTFYRRVREGAQAFQGLADCTLAHGEDWQFIRLGTFLERADAVARLLLLEAHLLHAGSFVWRTDEAVRWLAVLRSCGSAEAYARYYSLRVDPARVVEFVLLNPLFPQSLRFSVNVAWQALETLARDEPQRDANPALRALGRLRAIVEHTAVDEVYESGLDRTLLDIQRRIGEVTDAVTRGYLSEEPSPPRLQPLPAVRAAMLVAEQQQQQQ
jgi:uncharacterized alpha-E superfamily protein